MPHTDVCVACPCMVDATSDRELRRCDGILTFDAADYQPEATSALRAWLAKTGRRAYYAGPLIPQGPEETSCDPRAGRVRQCLDEKLASHGEHSLIYVRLPCSIRVMGEYSLGRARVLWGVTRSPSGRSSGRRTLPNSGRSSMSSWRRAFLS